MQELTSQAILAQITERVKKYRIDMNSHLIIISSVIFRHPQ